VGGDLKVFGEKILAENYSKSVLKNLFNYLP
jgi:hypothetical protein